MVAIPASRMRNNIGQGGDQPTVPSNIIVHRPNIIVQELNSVPALDEAGTEVNSQMKIFPSLDGNIIGLDEAGTEHDFQNGNIAVLGRKYYRPGTEILSALDGNIIGLDEAGTELDFQDGNIIGLGRKYCRPWTEILWA